MSSVSEWRLWLACIGLILFVLAFETYQPNHVANKSVISIAAVSVVLVGGIALQLYLSLRPSIPSQSKQDAAAAPAPITTVSGSKDSVVTNNPTVSGTGNIVTGAAATTGPNSPATTGLNNSVSVNGDATAKKVHAKGGNKL
jgi:hypothetical protein